MATETKPKPEDKHRSPGDKSQPTSVVQNMQQSVQHGCDSLEKCVEDNPASSLLISAVVGMGVGIAVGLALGAKHQPEPLGWFDSRTAEKMGHQFLAAMGRMVPESVSSRFS